jgi:type I restriction enzyme M protein
MTVKKYSDLDESAVKKLLITDKWSADIKHAITGEFNAEVTRLTHRLSELAERYSDTLPALESRAKELNAKVQGYLEQLGVKL